MMTLWDYWDASLLGLLQHLDDRSQIETLQFIKTNQVKDMIMTKSKTGLKLQSPFGRSSSWWSFGLLVSCSGVEVADIQLIHEQVAIVMYFQNSNTTKIGIVNASNGSSAGDWLEIKGQKVNLMAAPSSCTQGLY